jgi:uncharacterized damage-inducible protein DinB
MTRGALGRIVEHNNWANASLIRACLSLTDGQLEATPRSPRERSIRQVLSHLVESQVGYASMLSPDWRLGTALGSSLEDLARAAEDSGKALQEVADGQGVVAWDSDLPTRDGYVVKRWTVFVQAVNHGAEHRRQVCGILRALGVEPPRLDGWGFGEVTGAVVPAPRS